MWWYNSHHNKSHGYCEPPWYRDPDSLSLLLLLHCMWPWPRWQPPSPRLGWRKVLVAVTLHCPGFSHVAAPVFSGAWRQREGLLPGFHMQVKSRVCYRRRIRADFKDSQQSLPLVHSFGDLGEWEWSKLFVQFLCCSSFSHWIISSICKARGSFLVCVCQFCSNL